MLLLTINIVILKVIARVIAIVIIHSDYNVVIISLYKLD